jgi:hypothetical protein
VVRSVRDRVNVVCEAVAGSGKTTTVLHCARDVPDLTFLVLTYNARLKLTTRQRARELGLSNVETHSFHACAARYYLPGCRDDEALRRLVEEDAPPRSALRFDCLVVDEAQDMTPLLHRFVLKVLRDAGNETGGGSRSAQMLVLGDSRQSIYQFRDADPRFLTMADRGVYALASGTSADASPAWRHHALRTSFRASPRIASFVNDAMLGFACIKASPRAHLPDGGAGAPVTYMVGNAFQVASQEIADEIEYLLSPRGGGIRPGRRFRVDALAARREAQLENPAGAAGKHARHAVRRPGVRVAGGRRGTERRADARGRFVSRRSTRRKAWNGRW